MSKPEANGSKQGNTTMIFKTEMEAFNYAESTGKSWTITKTKKGWKLDPLKSHADWMPIFQANWASQVK